MVRFPIQAGGGILSITASGIRENLRRAKDSIAEALKRSGESREVTIMAVTKTHPAGVVASCIEAGIGIIGENRVSEGGRKIKELGRDSAQFHMIGPIHTKEVRQAIRDFHWIDSVDRLKIADEVARRTVASGSKQPGILLEVNTSGEDSKHGFAPDHSLLEEVLGHVSSRGLAVSGLLTVGPLSGDDSDVRKAFALLRSLRDRLRSSGGFSLSQLSMGMSDDFHIAVEEGSTMVRLGRFLLGGREN